MEEIREEIVATVTEPAVAAHRVVPQRAGRRTVSSETAVILPGRGAPHGLSQNILSGDARTRCLERPTRSPLNSITDTSGSVSHSDLMRTPRGQTYGKRRRTDARDVLWDEELDRAAASPRAAAAQTYAEEPSQSHSTISTQGPPAAPVASKRRASDLYDFDWTVRKQRRDDRTTSAKVHAGGKGPPVLLEPIIPGADSSEIGKAQPASAALQADTSTKDDIGIQSEASLDWTSGTTPPVIAAEVSDPRVANRRQVDGVRQASAKSGDALDDKIGASRPGHKSGTVAHAPPAHAPADSPAAAVHLTADANIAVAIEDGPSDASATPNQSSGTQPQIATVFDVFDTAGRAPSTPRKRRLMNIEHSSPSLTGSEPLRQPASFHHTHAEDFLFTLSQQEAEVDDADVETLRIPSIERPGLSAARRLPKARPTYSKQRTFLAPVAEHVAAMPSRELNEVEIPDSQETHLLDIHDLRAGGGSRRQLERIVELLDELGEEGSARSSLIELARLSIDDDVAPHVLSLQPLDRLLSTHIDLDSSVDLFSVLTTLNVVLQGRNQVTALEPRRLLLQIITKGLDGTEELAQALAQDKTAGKLDRNAAIDLATQLGGFALFVASEGVLSLRTLALTACTLIQLRADSSVVGHVLRMARVADELAALDVRLLSLCLERSISADGKLDSAAYMDLEAGLCGLLSLRKTATSDTDAAVLASWLKAAINAINQTQTSSSRPSVGLVRVALDWLLWHPAGRLDDPAVLVLGLLICSVEESEDCQLAAAEVSPELCSMLHRRLADKAPAGAMTGYLAFFLSHLPRQSLQDTALTDMAVGLRMLLDECQDQAEFLADVQRRLDTL